MFRLTVVYPAALGAPFDFEYYAKSHIPLVTSLIGASVVRTEVAKGLAGYGGGPAPYVAIGHIYLENLEGLQTAFQSHGTEIEQDVRKYTTIEPVVSIEAVVA